MSVRLRRLQADFEAVRRLARLHPRIEIEGVSGQPPERYRLTLKVRSLRERGEAIEPADTHRLEVALPLGYPRDAPLFRMLTPVFHPNVAPHAVCIGDHWTASESLDVLIQRVAEMLAFQSYNVKSPLNGRAARWVTENLDRLPLDRDPLFIDSSADGVAEGSPSPAGLVAAVCANCGAAGPLHDPCPSGHALCGDCAMECSSCSQPLCLACGQTACTACAPAAG